MAQRDWNALGARVQTARVAVGLSQSDLATAVGLDRTMVAKIESGVRRVDALELARLAGALSIPMALLLDDQPLVLSRRGVSLTEDTETEAGRESNRLDAVLGAWVHELRQLVGLGLLNPPPLMTFAEPVRSARDARRAAGWLRDQLRLGDDPIGSMLQLCADAGQFVLVTDLPGEGASAVDDGLGAAVVSVRGDPGRRRATAAHELGHLVLGDEYSSDLGVHASRAERESLIDTFASELLLPLAVFDAGDRMSRDLLLQTAARYRTSWSLTVKQAEAAGAGPIPRSVARSSPTPRGVHGSSGLDTATRPGVDPGPPGLRAGRDAGLAGRPPDAPPHRRTHARPDPGRRSAPRRGSRPGPVTTADLQEWGANHPFFFDTMCLSQFARADRLDVLRDLLLGRECWTTSVVRSELTIGAQPHPLIKGALELDWMRIATLDALDDLRCFVKWTTRLGSQDRDLGEASVLAAAELHRGIAITDDREATKVARRYGAQVHETIWLLAVACGDGKLTPVGAASIIDALRAQDARLPCTGSGFPAYVTQHGLWDRR